MESESESATLLRSSREKRHWVPVFAFVAFVAVACVGVATLSAERGVQLLSKQQQLAGVGTFGVDHDLPKLATNGEKCWMCPCCAGCEGTGAARAAGCGLPSAKEVHKKVEKKAIVASKKQAKMALEDKIVPAAASPKPAATAPVAVRKVKVAPKAKASPKQEDGKKPAALREDASTSGVLKKRLHMKHLQIKVATVGADDPRPDSDNANRIKDDMDMFEDASYLNPHKYDVPHLTKKIGANLHEDVIAPWVTGADRFKEHTQFNKDGTIKTFKHYEDPAGLFVQVLQFVAT